MTPDPGPLTQGDFTSLRRALANKGLKSLAELDLVGRLRRENQNNCVHSHTDIFFQNLPAIVQ